MSVLIGRFMRSESGRSVDVQPSILHGQMDGAKYLAENEEASGLGRNESDIRTHAGGKSESLLEVLSDLETVRLSAIIIDNVYDDILSN